MSRNETSRWRRAVSGLLDLTYPPRCACCGVGLAGGRSLCAECAAALSRLQAPFCERCGEPFDGAIDGPFTCPNCSDLHFSFEFARPALRLDPAARALIHQLKYGREIHLSEELGRLLVEGLEDPRFADALAQRWPLVPVPLHWRRTMWRHFNQAAEIARVAGRLAGLPVLPALTRTRATETQTHLNRRDRLANLTGAFVLTRRGRRWLESRPAGAILVDDVLTTGSTAEACARALRAAGCPRVSALMVMRG